MADSDHGNCIDSRRSVSGGMVFLRGVAVSWYSRRQQTTALSASESDYVALNEVTKGVVFLRQVQVSINPSMESYPGKKCDNNQGAIELANEP